MTSIKISCHLLLNFRLRHRHFLIHIFQKELFIIYLQQNGGTTEKKQWLRKHFKFCMSSFPLCCIFTNTEHKFSNFSLILNKLWNRLGLQTATKLVMACKMLNLKIKILVLKFTKKTIKLKKPAWLVKLCVYYVTTTGLSRGGNWVCFRAFHKIQH